MPSRPCFVCLTPDATAFPHPCLIAGTQTMDNGWRLSLGLAGVPAVILLFGSLLLPETPNSLIERGHRARGRAVLARLRGTESVDAEFEDICAAAEESTRYTLRQSWAALFSRQYSPMLIVTSLIAMLQQLTGINAVSGPFGWRALVVASACCLLCVVLGIV